MRISVALALAVAAVAALGVPSGATADPICTISGTPGDDVLTGTSGPDVICGLEGRTS